MKHRGRIRLTYGFLTLALMLAITTFSSTAFAQDQERDVNDVQIWKMIIRDSIASYPHICPCPYSTNRAGRLCGDRSVYSRVGALKCYPTDISEGEVARYRERVQ